MILTFGASKRLRDKLSVRLVMMLTKDHNIVFIVVKFMLMIQQQLQMMIKIGLDVKIVADG